MTVLGLWFMPCLCTLHWLQAQQPSAVIWEGMWAQHLPHLVWLRSAGV